MTFLAVLKDHGHASRIKLLSQVLQDVFTNLISRTMEAISINLCSMLNFQDSVSTQCSGNEITAYVSNHGS